MSFLRWAVIAGLYLTGIGTGLASFIALLVGFLGGMAWQFIAAGALLFGYAYACGETLKHLKAHDNTPWLAVGVSLIIVATITVVAWKYVG